MTRPAGDLVPAWRKLPAVQVGIGLGLVLCAALPARSAAQTVVEVEGGGSSLLGGYGAVEAYLPSKKIAVAVAVTFTPEAFDSEGNYPNASDGLFRSIGAYMTPDDPPPFPTKKAD